MRRYSLIALLLLAAPAAYGSSFACTNNSSTDPTGVRTAVTGGGTATITGTCNLGTSTFTISSGVVIQGGATFNNSDSSSNYTFNIGSSNVTITGMTFNGPTFHVTGSNTSTNNNLTITNNTFGNYIYTGVGSYFIVDPIITNATITGNTFQNIWLGGFSNTNSGNVCSLGGITYNGSVVGICNNKQQSGLVTGIYFGGNWGNNTVIEHNTFTQISGDALHIICTSCNASTPSTGVSVSYNKLTYIHRIGLEIQTNQILGNVYTGFKIAGNFFYHPAYAWTETYAYSLPLESNGLYMNNAAIGDLTGNSTNNINRLGLAFETPPGAAWAGSYETSATITWQGNVISSDTFTGQSPPGWDDSFTTYHNSASPNYYQNNLMCGPNNNSSTYNISGSGATDYSGKSNEIGRYNYLNSSSCPNGGGTSLWTSTLAANAPVWTSANNQTFSSGGNGTWALYVTAVNLPMQYAQFFIDSASSPTVTQEQQDLNSNFATDRKWMYHAQINTSTLSSGTHTIRAVVTDVSGATSSISQTFTVGAVTPTASTPVISPASGSTFATSLTVSISEASSGAVVYYTTDGTAPTTSSVVYSSPFSITASKTVKAFATLTGQASSAVASSSFVRAGPPASDDFNQTSLDTSVWTALTPSGGSVTVSGNHANFVVPAGANHDPFAGGNQSVRIIQNVVDADFSVAAKFDTTVSGGTSTQYLNEGILVQQDSGTYLRFELSSNGTTTVGALLVTGGQQTGQFTNVPIAGTVPVWLRVQRAGSTFTLSYSGDGFSYTPAGSFSQALTVSAIGLYAGNYSGTPSTALGVTSNVDYFYNLATTQITPPVDPIAPTTLSNLKAVPDGPAIILTDAPAIATDVSFGRHFRVTLGGNRTLYTPFNPVDGEEVTWEFIQDDTGNRTITLASSFALGSDVTDVTLSTGAGKHDFMKAIYNQSTNIWYVLLFSGGY